MRRVVHFGLLRHKERNLLQRHEISCLLISCAPQLLFFSVDFILCCEIFTIVVAYDFVLIKSSVELNSNSANLTWCVCVCVCVYMYTHMVQIYIYIWRGSSVGIVTRYVLDGPGSNPGGGEIFRIHTHGLWSSPSLVYNGHRVAFPGEKR